jgi:predicted membrane channel-forming protein YqfA (hemolysin III family)
LFSKNGTSSSSWFWLHNETVNIWSHLIGFLIFFYFLAGIVIFPPKETESNLELLPLIIQLISYQVNPT